MWGYHPGGCALMRDSPNRRVFWATGVEGLSKKTTESSATKTKWGPYPLSTHVNFSLTFPQVLWISPGKLWAEGVFLFLFQPSDSLCLIFKQPLFFLHPFHGGRPQGRARWLQITVKCALRKFGNFLRTDSLTLFASYGYDCRVVHNNDEKKRPFKKRRGQRNAPIPGPTVFATSNDDWNVVWVACDKVLLLKATRKRAWWAFQKAPHDRPLWPDVKKEFFKERRRQSQRSYSKPIGLYQGQWRLGGCKKLTGVSRQSSFHGMKRAVLEHFKNGRGALTHCLRQRLYVASNLDHKI